MVCCRVEVRSLCEQQGIESELPLFVGWGFAGDSRGIRGGSLGDSHAFRGIRPIFENGWPTFWGDSPATTAVFYNFKKGKEDAWGVWAPLGLGYRGEALPSVLKNLKVSHVNHL